MVTLKFITEEYLNKNQRNRTNLDHETSSLEKCKGQNWCLKLTEVLQFHDCKVIVTDLIYGVDLFKLTYQYRKDITEIEGRNIMK